MNIPKTADDLKNEIYLCSDKFGEIGDLRIRQLIKLLPNVSDQLIVDGIIKIFEDNEREHKSFKDQEFAGKILEMIKPKSKDEPKDLLKRIVKHWNKSIEQLPFWFEENYGFENFKTALFDLENMMISDIERDKIQTMKWWIGI